VGDYLVEQGVERSSISASGAHERSPAASNDTADCRQKNRRVEISAQLDRDVTRWPRVPSRPDCHGA
jgi:outer membrane protein OmpA-like peptidoglycan-associated protein